MAPDAAAILAMEDQRFQAMIAQDVAEAFAAEGLDADRYGVFCRDVFDRDGEQVEQLGVRYEELLAFIISAI